MYDVEKSSKKADKRHKRLEQRYESSVVKSGDPSLTKFFSTATSDILAVSKRVVYDIADGLEEVGGVLGLIDQSKNDELHFAEFVHMLQSGHLDDLFPDRDWKESCKEIHDLRRAFDSADVDGDNKLEQGEFELVMDTLHLGHDLTPDDVEYAWSVLRGATKSNDKHPHLTFIQFVVGVQHIKADERLAGRLDMTKESPWNMLSLLIDTPVSELEEERLTQNLNFLERVGLNMVKNYQVKMHRKHIREVLEQCVQNKLHYLSDDKKQRLSTVHDHCVVQALLIGFISCGISCPFENLFVFLFRNDGLVDIDCLCYTRGCRTNPGSGAIKEEHLRPGDTTIPGAFPDLFRNSWLTEFRNDPCRTRDPRAVNAQMLDAESGEPVPGRGVQKDDNGLIRPGEDDEGRTSCQWVDTLHVYPTPNSAMYDDPELCRDVEGKELLPECVPNGYRDNQDWQPFPDYPRPSPTGIPEEALSGPDPPGFLPNRPFTGPFGADLPENVPPSWSNNRTDDAALWCGDLAACQPLPPNHPRYPGSAWEEAWDPEGSSERWLEAMQCPARVNATLCGYNNAWEVEVLGDATTAACWSNPYAMAWFWGCCMSVVIFCAVIEIAMLMYYGVYHSMRVAWALGYRLSPLNEDRAFLADSLVRGAFELGNPDNALYGVNPMAEVGESGKWRIILVGLSWKGKIVLTAAIAKFVCGLFMPWQWAVWFKPWLSMPSDMFWNAMTAHIVMKQAQIRGVGIATAHEVFNEIMQDGKFFVSGKVAEERQASDPDPFPEKEWTEMRDIHKLQTARAIGVGIVKHGNLYPTMEVLLRHGVAWMKMRANPAVQTPGVLDNSDTFVNEMAQLTRDEKITTLCMHLLCMIMDGSVHKRHLLSWQEAVDHSNEEDFHYNAKRVRFVAQQFRNHVPLSAEMLRACFMTDEAAARYLEEHKIPGGCGGFRHRECMHWLTVRPTRPARQLYANVRCVADRRCVRAAGCVDDLSGAKRLGRRQVAARRAGGRMVPLAHWNTHLSSKEACVCVMLDTHAPKISLSAIV